ncbi:MAG: homoserine dehydrogenase [Muribaculaceae bacterium]|nr:homoserine dehydrogenase [Muribaculaceae bacterium]
MKHLNIGLFGYGTVGRGIAQVISRAKNAHAGIGRICVRNLAKHTADTDHPELFTDNADDIFNDPNINLIVEVIDNAEAAWEIVRRALVNGMPVVTGNKAMVARHLPELIELQREHGTPLLYDASSCGSIPVIRNLEEYYDNDLLLEVKGILNGSTNYILSRVFDHGEDYAAALAKAQELGFAESDPSFDIDGLDALFKLIIITVHAVGTYVPPEKIFTYGIGHIHESDIRYAREKGVKIKLVAQVVKISETQFTMFVMPEFVSPSKYIYSVDDEYNGVVIRGECYDRQFMFGKGAGALPTASSILSDIMALRHDYRYEYKKMSYIDRPEYTDDVLLRIYARYTGTNLPALLPTVHVHEQYISKESNYIVADIRLRDLIECRAILDAPDVFIANIPQFFIDKDN